MPQVDTTDVARWRDVVRQAVTLAFGDADAPLPGARFRDFVERVADEQSLEFPPEPDLRFRDFLLRFPDTLRMVHREGQDFLIVPSDRPELLVADEMVVVRRDLFRAFTYLAQPKTAWYETDRDRIRWLEPAAAESEPGLVAITPQTLDSELDVRRAFIATCGDADQPALETALLAARPLSAFGEAVRERHLQKPWHAFRTERVIRRLEAWAAEAGIPWRDSWVQVSTARRESPRDGKSVPGRAADDLAGMLAGLDDAERRRILVPLDVVQKLLDRSGPRR